MTDINRRQVLGKPDVYGQGTAEKIVYICSLRNMLEGKGVASTPTFKIWNLGTSADETASKASGVAQYDANTFEFTTPTVLNLEKDVLYRIVGQVQVGSQELSWYKDIRGEL